MEEIARQSDLEACISFNYVAWQMWYWCKYFQKENTCLWKRATMYCEFITWWVVLNMSNLSFGLPILLKTSQDEINKYWINTLWRKVLISLHFPLFKERQRRWAVVLWQRPTRINMWSMIIGWTKTGFRFEHSAMLIQNKHVLPCLFLHNGSPLRFKSYRGLSVV